VVDTLARGVRIPPQRYGALNIAAVTVLWIAAQRADEMSSVFAKSTQALSTFFLSAALIRLIRALPALLTFTMFKRLIELISKS
jgi:hypothetical protein